MATVKVTHVLFAAVIVPLLAFSTPLVVHRAYGAALGALSTSPLPPLPSPEGFGSSAQLDLPGDRVDIYGNPVSSAISAYASDPAGGRYELHAPQVALPRLGSPIS